VWPSSGGHFTYYTYTIIAASCCKHKDVLNCIHVTMDRRRGLLIIYYQFPDVKYGPETQIALSPMLAAPNAARCLYCLSRQAVAAKFVKCATNYVVAVAYRGGFGGFKPPRNSEAGPNSEIRRK
jgi:hypothetical protein